MPFSLSSLRWSRSLRRPGLLAALALCGGFWAAPTVAAAAEPDRNVVSFSTQATVEVNQDWLSMTLAVTREGNDPQALQGQLKQVLDGALTDARRAAQPGLLEVHTGSFNVTPRYGRDSRITGWVGTAELVLEGRDLARVAATAGKLNGMVVTGSGYSLSRDLRAKYESELVAQAIQQFRQRASEIAAQFGFSGYGLKEVNVQGLEQQGGPVPMYRMRATAAAAAEAAPVPTEPGKGTLTATVQGSVQLTR
ncbi:MAG: SIMPL domain-containing protein [Burkholderiales bacterium]